MSTRVRIENADTVSLVCALLVRFPELASIRSGPADRTLRLTFAVRQRLDRASQIALGEAIEEHVRGFLALSKDEPKALRVECEGDPAAEDEAALYAVEALRDPLQPKSLVGFREEKRVLVYFLKSQKKAKASARR